MNYYKTIISLFLGYVSISQVSAEALTPPLKARFNSEVFKKVINRRDQEMLKVFNDMPLNLGHGEEVTAAGSRLSGLRASLTARDGINHDDLDFDIHLEKEFFGAQSSEL